MGRRSLGPPRGAGSQNSPYTSNEGLPIEREMDAPAELSSRLIGSIFVEKGLITQDQLDTALRMQQETGERLGEIVVGEFGVPRLELASVLAEQWAEHERIPEVPQASTLLAAGPADAPGAPAPLGEPLLRRPIGEIFVERGFVTDEQLRSAVELQLKTGQRLGEVLVEQGVLSRLDLASALAEQWSNLQRTGQLPAVAERSMSQSVAGPSAPAADDGALAARIAALEEAVASAVVVRAELDAVAGDVRGELSALEERLSEARPRSASEVAAITSQIDSVREVLEERARALGALEERAVDASQLTELGERVQAELAALGERIDVLAADTRPADALERLGARLDGMTEQQASANEMLQALRDRAEQLGSAVAEAQARPIDPELAAKVDAVAGQAEAAQSGLASLASRFDEIGALSARIDGVAAQLPGMDVVDELRRSLTELSDQAAANADRPDQIAALGARLDQLSAQLEDLAGRIAGAAAPVAELEVGLDAVGRRLDELGLEPVGVDLGPVEGRLAALEETTRAAAELRSRIDSLEGRAGQEVRAHDIEILGSRLGELEEQVGASADADALRAELRSATEASAAARASLEESLTSRIHEIVGATSPATDELAALRLRVDEIAAQRAVGDRAEAVAIDDLRCGLDEVRMTISELGELSRRIELLEAAPSPDAALAPRFDAIEEAAARLSAVEERLDDLAGSSATRRELNARIDSLEARVAGAAGEDALQSLRDEHADRLVALQQSIDDSRAGAAQAADGLTRRVDESLGGLHDEIGAHGQRLDERLADLDSDVGAIRSEVAEIAGAVGDRDEWREGVEAGLSTRVDGLEEQLAGAARTAGDQAAALGSLEEGVDELRGRVDELHTLRADDAEGARITGADLAARIDDVAHRLAENAATAEGGLRHELEQLASRLAEAEATSTGAKETARGEIERLFSSVSWRLEQVEGALAEASPSTGLEMIEHLEQRLDAQAAQAEEQVRVTEKALRKGSRPSGRSWPRPTPRIPIREMHCDARSSASARRSPKPISGSQPRTPRRSTVLHLLLRRSSSRSPRPTRATGWSSSRVRRRMWGPRSRSRRTKACSSSRASEVAAAARCAAMCLSRPRVGLSLAGGGRRSPTLCSRAFDGGRGTPRPYAGQKSSSISVSSRGSPSRRCAAITSSTSSGPSFTPTPDLRRDANDGAGRRVDDVVVQLELQRARQDEVDLPASCGDARTSPCLRLRRHPAPTSAACSASIEYVSSRISPG